MHYISPICTTKSSLREIQTVNKPENFQPASARYVLVKPALFHKTAIFGMGIFMYYVIKKGGEGSENPKF